LNKLKPNPPRPNHRHSTLPPRASTCEPIDFLDDRLGETGTGDRISDQDRG
jgi:hypothetical protein